VASTQAEMEEGTVDLVEMKRKERLGREEAAGVLREVADQLARHNEVTFERDGLRFRAHVPDEVEMKLEFEYGDDGAELELELTWK
jgi:amphi-Trp domain-containing protein